MTSVALVITAGEMQEPISWRVPDGRAVVFSRRCPGRESENEDSALVLELAPHAVVLAVADGAGGHASGAHASRIAVNVLQSSLEAHEVVQDDEWSMRTAILNGIESANREIHELGIGAATTLTVALVEHDRFRCFQIGDSKAIVTGQRGRIRFESIAHSPVGYAIESGMIAEREAIDHEERHLVSNMMGTTDMRIDVGPIVSLRPLDTVILGSDGLFDNAYQSEIIEHARKGPLEDAARVLAEQCTKRMVEAPASQPSKPDDLTFVLYRMERDRTRRKKDGAGTATAGTSAASAAPASSSTSTT